MKTNDILEQQIAIFRKFYNDNEAGGSSRWLVAPNVVEVFLRSFYLVIIEGVEEEVDETIKNTRACRKRGCLTCGTGNGVVKALSDLQARLAKRKI